MTTSRDEPLNVMARVLMPDEGEYIRVLIVDAPFQTDTGVDTEICGLIVREDGVAQLLTWPDGENAETVELRYRKEPT